MKLRHPQGRVHGRKALLALYAASAAGAVQAVEIDAGNPDVKMRWDNTVKYSTALRLEARSAALAKTVAGPTGIVGPNNTNQDDGDNNFSRGPVSSRIDWLSEFDVRYGNVGARVSGAAWYDQVYNRRTDNTTSTANHVPASEFADETRKVMGRKAELLDAFVFGKADIGGRPVTARLGRHTLLWGETLFYGANGIAGGMAPVDLVKSISVPGSQFKETVRPTGKLSGQVQVTDDMAVAFYIPYEWAKTRLAPAGSYLSAVDTIGPGTERINAGPVGVFLHAPDVEARNSGQGGAQVRWHAETINADFGLYAIRYHASTPSNIVSTLSGSPPALSASTYRWFYHEGIRAFGASFAKSYDEWSFAGEAVYRENVPLASSGQAVIPATGVGVNYNNSDRPPYAVGETAHLNLSWTASLGPGFISNEASFIGEIAWNTRVKVTRNPHMLNPNGEKSAAALRTIYTATYRQVAPGLDLAPSLGLSYTRGKSSALGAGFGPNRGGDINLGIGAVYLGLWNFNMSYVHYYGPRGSALDNNANGQFKQALKDRDFLTFAMRTTF